MLGRKDDRPPLPHTSTSCLHIYSSSLSIKFVSWFVSDANSFSAETIIILLGSVTKEMNIGIRRIDQYF